MSYEDIKTALIEFDDKRLTLDNLKALTMIIPSPEEQEVLREHEHKENLGVAEQFGLVAMTVPHLEGRIASFMFKLSFRSKVGEFMPVCVSHVCTVGLMECFI